MKHLQKCTELAEVLCGARHLVEKEERKAAMKDVEIWANKQAVAFRR